MSRGKNYIMEQIIQKGKAQKLQQGEMSIDFNEPFKHLPIVVISPLWENQHVGVGYIDTITEITLEGFKVSSNNASASFFINWIAVGD